MEAHDRGIRTLSVQLRVRQSRSPERMQKGVVGANTAECLPALAAHAPPLSDYL